ncbi:hypothetical protein [Demequina sp. SO4-18]|uniref:variant leucine-rich repeat-containing protein n=1 Tax=Demequina sp. SO4-18 TaxID=3401026 RepID=UPI003B5B7A4F
MARGFNYAPGASDDVEQAAAPALQRSRIAALVQSRNAVVREVLAARSDLGLGQMATLAHDRSAQVRTALAANPAAAPSVLEHLAGDRHVPVLVALLGNPATPPDVAERLSSHRKSEVRTAAASRMDGHAGGSRPTPIARAAPVGESVPPQA